MSRRDGRESLENQSDRFWGGMLCYNYFEIVQKKTMASIILQVDEEIKTAFEQANPEIQKQLSNIIQLFLQERLYSKSLTDLIAEISDKAQKRG
ncbi:MAG: hypothetical protein AB4290_25540, partial [Spirulina sp.]